MPELALDHDQGDAFVRHLDRVRMSKLMRRESTPDTRSSSCVVELPAYRRRLPPSSRGRSVDHAQQRADRECRPSSIHSTPPTPAFAALPAPDEHGAAGAAAGRSPGD